MNPKYSILLYNQKRTAYESYIRQWLKKGIKVFWLGCSFDVMAIKKDFEKYADALMLQTFEINISLQLHEGIVFLMPFGDLGPAFAGRLNSFRSLRVGYVGSRQLPKQQLGLRHISLGIENHEVHRMQEDADRAEEGIENINIVHLNDAYSQIVSEEEQTD